MRKLTAIMQGAQRSSVRHPSEVLRNVVRRRSLVQLIVKTLRFQCILTGECKGPHLKVGQREYSNALPVRPVQVE